MAKPQIYRKMHQFSTNKRQYIFTLFTKCLDLIKQEKKISIMIDGFFIGTFNVARVLRNIF